MVQETKHRPPRLSVEQRSLNDGCIEIARLFFRVSPTKGLFPIQDTRSLDNTHEDRKATQWGGIIQHNKPPQKLLDALTQVVSAGSICPSRNKYTDMKAHIHIEISQTVTHAQGWAQ